MRLKRQVPLPPATIPKERHYQRWQKGAKRDLNPRNPFSWVRPFPSPKFITNLFPFFCQTTKKRQPHHHHHQHTSTHPHPRHKIPPLNTPTIIPHSVTIGQHPVAIKGIGSYLLKYLTVAPSASTLHEHPVVSCEPVNFIASRPSPQLYFLIWLFHPTHNWSPDPDPDRYLRNEHENSCQASLKHHRSQNSNPFHSANVQRSKQTWTVSASPVG